MQGEIGYIRQASGVERIRYWSGGNLYPYLLEVATCAGLEVNSDWKNPRTQTTDFSLVGVHPWRPSGSPNGEGVRAFVTHDPNRPVIFLSEGRVQWAAYSQMADAYIAWEEAQGQAAVPAPTQAVARPVYADLGARWWCSPTSRASLCRHHHLSAPAHTGGRTGVERMRRDAARRLGKRPRRGYTSRGRAGQPAPWRRPGRHHGLSPGQPPRRCPSTSISPRPT